MSEQQAPQAPQELDPQTPIILNLNVSLVQGILVALGKLPYEQAAGLIDIIRSQAAPQLQKGETK